MCLTSTSIESLAGGSGCRGVDLDENIRLEESFDSRTSGRDATMDPRCRRCVKELQGQIDVERVCAMRAILAHLG